MISKASIKLITSLQIKKFRDEHKLFVIEGDKLVKEFLIARVPVKMLLAKPEFLSSLPKEITRFVETTESVSFDELKQVSSLKTPHNALAVVRMPSPELDFNTLFKHFCIALDFIQDPGNLGTIIRAAGWFGIRNIVCSPDCVDVYNPKVIQASMGALLHVNIYYHDLKNLLVSAGQNSVQVFGTVLNGKSIYSHDLGKNGVILLGNESKGISNDLIPFINEKISIPKFSQASEGIDSLNVGMAASIVLSEFIRRSVNLTD